MTIKIRVEGLYRGTESLEELRANLNKGDADLNSTFDQCAPASVEVTVTEVEEEVPVDKFAEVRGTAHNYLGLLRAMLNNANKLSVAAGIDVDVLEFRFGLRGKSFPNHQVGFMVDARDGFGPCWKLLGRYAYDKDAGFNKYTPHDALWCKTRISYAELVAELKDQEQKHAAKKDAA